MKLSNENEIRAFLGKEGFVFKKSLGQNFLVDSTVAPRMAAAAADKNTGVIEIGPGAGVLTRELSRAAKRVVAIEIDEKLRPILEKTLGDRENVSVIFADVLKTDLRKIIAEKLSDCERITVCANLPYYITSPVIMKLLREKLPVQSITVMVQKEAADRICAKVGSRSAGVITAVINYYAETKPLFFVPKGAFLPEPKVNSEVITLTLRQKPPVEVDDEEFFFKVINACFMLRRKTAVNSISSALGVDKGTVRAALENIGVEETARGETFDMRTLALLTEELLSRI
ncbi:MAG: 16S rRNA (adenine(1518)-N(6)/adenine(1519)-N(6))-dimethyltransferase RsmA [Clostridia bacterium]|nr:16S rRNA (adenine(1518)-N(6)/adenine(1519)-N(6))-dimethyltransferase RsmA [Clostridia bacterium]